MVWTISILAKCWRTADKTKSLRVIVSQFNIDVILFVCLWYCLCYFSCYRAAVSLKTLSCTLQRNQARYEVSVCPKCRLWGVSRFQYLSKMHCGHFSLIVIPKLNSSFQIVLAQLMLFSLPFARSFLETLLESCAEIENMQWFIAICVVRHIIAVRHCGLCSSFLFGWFCGLCSSTLLFKYVDERVCFSNLIFICSTRLSHSHLRFCDWH